MVNGHGINSNISPGHITRLRRAFHLADELRASQIKYFMAFDNPLHKLENSTRELHAWDIRVSPPLDDWGLRLGEVFNHLSSLKDNIFKEIVAKSARDLDVPNKFLRGAYWPSCDTREKWETLRSKYQFVPEEVMSRIEVFQPFRDLSSDGEGAKSDEAFPSASTWARRVNNEDKHDRPAEVAIRSYINGTITAQSDFTAAGPATFRKGDVDPHTTQPLLEISSEPTADLDVELSAIDIQVLQRTGANTWGSLNYNMWLALMENFAIISVLCRGQRQFHSLIPTWCLRRPQHLSDFRYQFNGTAFDIADIGFDLTNRALNDKQFWAILTSN